MSLYLIGAVVTFSTVFWLEPDWGKMCASDTTISLGLMVLVAAAWPLVLWHCFYYRCKEVRDEMVGQVEE